MSFNMNRANAVLKDIYLDLRSQINNNVFLLEQLAKNTTDFEGRRAVQAIHLRRSSGVGARGDGAVLPTAGSQGYTNVYVPVRYNYGVVEITHPTIKAMKSDRGSFVRALASELEGIRNDLARDMNRQAHGTSDGVIAACGTTSSSTTINLAATTTETQMRQLWANSGMRVDIGTPSNPTAVASDRRVIGYDIAARTITIDGGNVSTTSSHRVFRAGGGGGPGTTGLPGDGQYELTGLQHIISDTGNLHTIDPANEPDWASTVLSNGGTLRAPSENLVNRAIHDTEIASGKQIKMLLGSPGVSRALANLMQSMRRNIDNVELKGGYSGIQWSTPAEGIGRGKPIVLVWDQDHPQNELVGISLDTLVDHVLSDWAWIDEDGNVLHRKEGRAAFEAVFHRYSDIGCIQRNANFRIKDLIEA